MPQGPVSEPRSPALMQRRQEPPSPTVLVGKCLSPSAAPGLLSLGAPEPWSFAAGPCGQPCTGTGLCRVQHCRALPALTPFLPHLCSLLAFSLLSPHPCLDPSLCTCSPFFLAAAARVAHGGPPVSPWLWEVERFCTLEHRKGRAASRVLPARQSPLDSHLTPGNMPCHTVPCQANAPAASTCLAAEGFRQAARSPSLLSTHLKH